MCADVFFFFFGQNLSCQNVNIIYMYFAVSLEDFAVSPINILCPFSWDLSRVCVFWGEDAVLLNTDCEVVCGDGTVEGEGWGG